MAKNVSLKIKKLVPTAILPQYQTPGAACFDLHALHAGTVAAGDPKTFGTGLAFEVPNGHVLMIYSRSGHGFKNDMRLANCVGVIDSDYRGEVCVRLTNDQGGPAARRVTIKTGDRIAQGMLVRIPGVDLVEADEISETERGAGGLGSTGA